MPKFAFVYWDWKEQINVEEVNKVLDAIGEPVKFTQIRSGSDSYVVVIHTKDMELTEAQLVKLMDATHVIDLEEHRIGGGVYEVTPEKLKWLLEVDLDTL